MLIELVLELLLPLDGQRSRAEDEDPVGHRPQVELLGQEPGHDGLACTGIVGEDKSQPSLGQHVLVDGDDLVRQAANAREADREVRVVGEGEFDPVRLGQVEKVVR